MEFFEISAGCSHPHKSLTASRGHSDESGFEYPDVWTQNSMIQFSPINPDHNADGDPDVCRDLLFCAQHPYITVTETINPLLWLRHPLSAGTFGSSRYTIDGESDI